MRSLFSNKLWMDFFEEKTWLFVKLPAAQARARNHEKIKEEPRERLKINLFYSDDLKLIKHVDYLSVRIWISRSTVVAVVTEKHD